MIFLEEYELSIYAYFCAIEKEAGSDKNFKLSKCNVRQHSEDA